VTTSKLTIQVRVDDCFQQWMSLFRVTLAIKTHQAGQVVLVGWVGIVSFCEPDNKVTLGFVERLSNKIRRLQKRTFGYHDEDYFRQKILTFKPPTW